MVEKQPRAAYSSGVLFQSQQQGDCGYRRGERPQLSGSQHAKETGEPEPQRGMLGL
jgi:hypothetical protein